jgi:hypothetical protein
MVNDEPSLIISYYPDFEGKIFTCSRILSEFRITVRSGSVEILIETNNRSWGLQLFMLPPPPLGHPPYCDNS